MTIGVLALQGDYAAHLAMLRALGAQSTPVRRAGELDALDALVIPGGESTTMSWFVEREGLREPLRELAARGTPVLGTCAGMIMLDRSHLGVMDMDCERNAFGRQAHSFETDLEVAGVPGGPLRAMFIRAPRVADAGPDVEVLASVDGHGVVVRQGELLACAFHPELTGEDRLHRLLVERVRARARRC